MIITHGPVLPPISTKGLTPSDVPSLAEETRKIMISALEDLSSSVTAKRISQSSSPTPLLAGESRRTSGYLSFTDEAPLQGAVVGAVEDPGGDEGTKNGRRYSIA